MWAGGEQTSCHSLERLFQGSPKCSGINIQAGGPLEGLRQVIVLSECEPGQTAGV
jgi:hypothetical protein